MYVQCTLNTELNVIANLLHVYKTTSKYFQTVDSNKTTTEKEYINFI